MDSIVSNNRESSNTVDGIKKKVKPSVTIEEVDHLSSVAKVNVLSKVYSRVRANSPVDRNGKGIKRIWQEIHESHSSTPYKPGRTERYKIPKHTLHKYLRKRYPGRICEIIMHQFKFPTSFNLDEYCEVIQNWVF